MEAFTDLVEQLRRRGERLTPQRRLVLEILQNSEQHLSAEAIARAIVLRYPNLQIDQATIYRTLKWLHQHDLVSETSLGRNHMVYSLLSAHHNHHHLVCDQCHTVIEVEPELLVPVAAALQERYGFQARLAHISLFGTCAACRLRNESEA